MKSKAGCNGPRAGAAVVRGIRPQRLSRARQAQPPRGDDVALHFAGAAADGGRYGPMSLVVAGFLAGAVGVTARFFRWE
jgi:hypothetical protein